MSEVDDLIAKAKAQMANFQLVKKPQYQKKSIEGEQYAFYQIMHGGANYRVYPKIHLWLPTYLDLLNVMEDEMDRALNHVSEGAESALVAVHGHSHDTACGTLYMCHMAFYRYTGKRQHDWHERWDHLYGN